MIQWSGQRTKKVLHLLGIFTQPDTSFRKSKDVSFPHVLKINKISEEANAFVNTYVKFV